jgi:hypothetical protein
MKTNLTKHVPVDPIAHAKPDNLWDPRQVARGFSAPDDHPINRQQRFIHRGL